MTGIEQFRASLPEAAPSTSLDLALQALWWAGKHDWDRAHRCVQQNEGEPRCDWVHGYLHRVEGDLTNAGYWYRRSGRGMPVTPTEEEWRDIATALLA